MFACFEISPILMVFIDIRLPVYISLNWWILVSNLNTLLSDFVITKRVQLTCLLLSYIYDFDIIQRFCYFMKIILHIISFQGTSFIFITFIISILSCGIALLKRSLRQHNWIMSWRSWSIVELLDKLFIFNWFLIISLCILINFHL